LKIEDFHFKYIMKKNALIFFDGVCNFCNSSVYFIIKRDKKNYFKFSPLQSEYSKNILLLNNLKSENFESIILYDNNRLYQKSTAVLMIARHLRCLWKLFYVFIIIPPFIRDFFYDIIAKNRYKWFGSKESCMIPTAEIKEKFL
jgi:predicted DCC family thiol-disulfide oxidoreductase YuxK